MRGHDPDQHVALRKHPDGATLLDDQDGSDVVIVHHLNRIEHRTLGADRAHVPPLALQNVSYSPNDQWPDRILFADYTIIEAFEKPQTHRQWISVTERAVPPCGLALFVAPGQAESLMGHARAERERREHHRVDVDGRALLFHRGDPLGQYALENLSAGGVMVTGDGHLRPGHLVHVLIDLSATEQPMSLTGSIRRVRNGGNGHDGLGVAIAFPSLSADQEDAIQDAVLRALLRRDSHQPRQPLLVFEPRRRVREEIESEIRSFGIPVKGVDCLADAVRELEDEETEYAGMVIHSVTRESRAMDVVEFFTRSENLRTIILPEPDGVLCERAERLAQLPQVSVPRVWSRTELRLALTD